MIYPLRTIGQDLFVKTAVKILCEVTAGKRDKCLGLEVVIYGQRPIDSCIAVVLLELGNDLYLSAEI